MNTKLASLLAASLLAALPSPVRADGNTCVPWTRSVPKKYDPPSWAGAMGGDVNTSLDDPRWNQSVAHSFAYGSAVDPLHVRAIWWDEDLTKNPPTDVHPKYLYLSFVSDLSPDSTVAQDIFLGFRPATQTGTGFTKGYILQFHVEGGDMTASAMPYCGRYQSSTTYGCNVTTRKTWWRAFASDGTTGDCGAIVGGAQFKQIGTQDAAPFDWLTNNVHAWQSSTDGRWGVQMRIQIGGTGDIAGGIEEGSTFWYQVTESVAPTALVNIGIHPENVTTSFCRAQQAGNDRIVHDELDTATEWSSLTYVAKGSEPGASCDQGLSIEGGHIGAVHDTAGPYDTIALTNKLDHPGTNTVIAQITNDASTAFNGPVRARFRIADWGAQVPGLGDWRDIPGGSAVTQTLSIPSGQRKALHFNWVLTPQDLCQYGFQGASCAACTTCGDAVNGCIQVTGQPATCTSKKTPSHQCVQVSLTSPNNQAKFLRSSAFRNLDFDTMSTFTRDATISVKGVPGRDMAQPQDVLLFLAPRNLPKTIKQQTGAQYIAERAMAYAMKVSNRHTKQIRKMNAAELTKFGEGRLPLKGTALKEGKLVGLNAAKLRTFESSRTAITKQDFELTGALRDFAADTIGVVRGTAKGGKPDAATATRKIVHAVGPSVAAKIVPTVEVYPFYKPVKGDVYMPLTSFSVFLSHDGELAGFTPPTLSGANVEKLPGSKKNVYKLSVPAKETKAKVTIKVESKDRPTPPTKDYSKTTLTWQ